MPSSPAEFRKEIEEAINRCSMENASNTPDFVLAKFLCACLEAFDAGARERETWYGRSYRPGSSAPETPARPPLISDEERARRQPPPPAVLLDAQELSGLAPGRLIWATPVLCKCGQQGPGGEPYCHGSDRPCSCACHAAPAVPLREGTLPATLRHDAGAFARCSYCKRYSLDPRTLSDRPPACACGEKHGWSGSFVRPGPDAAWSGTPPSSTPPGEAGT